MPCSNVSAFVLIQKIHQSGANALHEVHAIVMRLRWGSSGLHLPRTPVEPTLVAFAFSTGPNNPFALKMGLTRVGLSMN
jgi:hypothetical protein